MLRNAASTHKNVLILSEDFPPYVGGIAQWAAGVAEALSRGGHEVRVLTRYRDGFFEVDQSAEHFPVITMRGKRWKQFRTWYCYKNTRDVCRAAESLDCVIATTWNCARGVIPLARRYAFRLATVLHGLEVTRRMTKIKRGWLSHTLRSSHRVIAVSGFTRERVLDRGLVPADRITVIPNGINPRIFQEGLDVHSLRQRLGLNKEKIILTLARMEERKGHDQVIKALPRVRERVPDLKYIIAGPKTEEVYQKLRALIERLGLQNVVIFTGYVRAEEVSLFYNLCDVYVMPSRELIFQGDTEGFGITFLEANACGKPVIGGDSGGVGDAVADGETGFLVDPLDTVALAEKLILILTDRQLAHRLGNQGRKRVERHYTWDKIARDIMDAIF